MTDATDQIASESSSVETSKIWVEMSGRHYQHSQGSNDHSNPSNRHLKTSSACSAIRPGLLNCEGDQQGTEMNDDRFAESAQTKIGARHFQ